MERDPLDPEDYVRVLRAVAELTGHPGRITEDAAWLFKHASGLREPIRFTGTLRAWITTSLTFPTPEDLRYLRERMEGRTLESLDLLFPKTRTERVIDWLFNRFNKGL